jgi:hypothetical protein
MPPGNPDDPFDRENPRTKIQARIDELGLVLPRGVDCPASLGYVQGPQAGTFDLIHSLRAGFGMTPLADVDGKQAVVTVEVVGSNGLYAKAEKTITIAIPPPDPEPAVQ